MKIKLEKVKKLPIEAKYFLISDLHLGIGDGADDSLHNQHIVFHILFRCLRERQHVIILGDLFDMAENTNIEKIKNAHDNIMWLLGELDSEHLLTYIRGNHDAYVEEKDIELRTHQYDGETVQFLNNTDIYDAVEIGNFLLLHGHQVMWRYASWFNRVVTWLGRHAWHHLQIRMCKDPSTDQQGWQEASDTDLELQKYGEKVHKIIIAGHTHKCKIMPGYINIGSFGVLPRGVTYGVLDHGQITLRKASTGIDENGFMVLMEEPIHIGE